MKLFSSLPEEIREKANFFLSQFPILKRYLNISRFHITPLLKTKVSCKNYKFYIDLPEGWFREQILKKGCHEPGLSHLLLKTLENDRVFWDVGAARGYHTLLASQVLQKEGNIHSFEPHPYQLKILSHNLEKYKVNSKVVEKRVTNSIETSRLENSRTTGDIYGSICGYPDVIKIDVEGGEIEVLKGLKEILLSGETTLFVEVHPSIRPDTHPSVVNFLLEKSYSIKQIKDLRRKSWKVKTISNPIEIEHSTKNYMIIAIPPA